MAATVSYGNIKIAQYELISIESLKLHQALNQHTQLQLKGILPHDVEDNYMKELTIDQPIEIKKEDSALFSGIIVEMEVNHSGGIYYISLKALSCTYLMDLVPKSRSFQNQSMTYENLIRSVISGYQRADCMDKITQGAAIEKPIIQYRETDWEFLKRMASRFQTSLVPYSLSPGPKFYFGLPKIEKNELTVHHYRVKKDLAAYQKFHQHVPGAHENSFIYYEVETDQILNLGDTVKLFKRTMHVIEATLEEHNQSVIKNRYLLAFEKGAQRPRIHNQRIAGSSIFGRVIATARDNVKVHLEIDQSQEVSTAYWFPYATMYASEDETGWYCMPEINDTVRLYFPDDEEEKGMVINSVKPHDPSENIEALDPSHRMADTNVKYLRTAFGKELKFRPNGIDIISKDGMVYMSLNDDGTVTLNSNDKISFTAVNDIEIKARNVNMEATDHIKIEAKESSIDLEKDITVTGKEVKTN